MLFAIRKSFFLSIATALALPGISYAADGSWNVTGGGDWGTAGNWTPGIASDADATATFGDVIAANSIINLDLDITIGNITASDVGQNYTISNATSTLMLDVTSPAKPIIDVTTAGRTLTISTVIEGNDGLQKNGAGTLLLDGVSPDFTGDLSIEAGTLRIGNNNTNSRLGGTTFAGAISNNGTLWFTNNQNQELSGVISGSGVLNRGGQGTLTLSGNNTYTGKTIIAGSGAGAPGLSVSSFNSVNGGTPLLLSSSLGAPTTVANGTIQFGSSGNTRSCTLTYTGSGETTDRVMDVQFNSNAFHTIASNATGGGVLTFTSNFTIVPSSGSASGGLRLRGSGDGEIAQIGTIPGILEKNDAGTWKLGGTNAANSVTVVDGMFLVNGSLAATTTVAVNGSSTLGGNATIGGAVTFSGTSTLSPGNSPGQMIFDDSLNLGGTTNSIFELGGTTIGSLYDNVTITTDGILAYGGNLDVSNYLAYDMDATSFTYDLFAFDGTTSPTGDFASVTVNAVSLSNGGSGVWTGVNGSTQYTFTQSTGDLSIVAVPEPGAIAIAAAGVGLIGVLLRRRRMHP